MHMNSISLAQHSCHDHRQYRGFQHPLYLRMSMCLGPKHQCGDVNSLLLSLSGQISPASEGYREEFTTHLPVQLENSFIWNEKTPFSRQNDTVVILAYGPSGPTLTISASQETGFSLMGIHRSYGIIPSPNHLHYNLEIPVVTAAQRL